VILIKPFQHPETGMSCMLWL